MSAEKERHPSWPGGSVVPLSQAGRIIEEQTEDPSVRAARLIAEQHARVAEIDRQRALSEAAEAAEQKATPVAFVDCRTFGHAWLSIEADRNPAIGWYMKARCERCNTVRSDIVNRYGTVESRRYEYPESYKDTDHWTRSDWRMQFLRRLS